VEEKPSRKSKLVPGDISGDFVPLTGSCVVSPQMKVSVRLGRFDLEMNGVQIVNVYHDPLISAARLMMPETESPYYIKPDIEPDVPRMIPFFSEQQILLDSFGFIPRSEGSSLIFTAPQYKREDVDLRARYYSEKLGSEVQAGVFEVIQRVIGAIGMLTDWPTDIGLPDSWDRIEVRIAWAFLRRLTEETGQSFDHEFASENLISVIELRS
jgi:hypothetical protein